MTRSRRGPIGHPKDSYRRVARAVAAFGMALAAGVLLLGWGLDIEWLQGRPGAGWPTTTPWTAVLFGVVSWAATIGCGPRGRTVGHLRAQRVLLWAALLMTSALAVQTATRVRGQLATALFRSTVESQGGYFPGMPSVQTLGILFVVSIAGLLLVADRAELTRTMLLATAAVAGVSGAIVTAGSAVASIGSGGDIYGFSPGSATLTVICAFSLTSIRADSAPAAVMRTHPQEAVLLLSAGGILGTPSTYYYATATVGAQSALGAAGFLMFLLLAAGVTWVAWFAMTAESWRSIAESGADATLTVDRTGTIATAGGDVLELTGWSAEELVGQPIGILVPSSAAETHAENVQGFMSEPRPGMMRPRSVRLYQKDGTPRLVSIRLVPSTSQYGLRVAALVNDASREAEFQRKSIEDPLTGALNRAGIVAELEQAILHEGAAVLFCDVDGFKNVNDTLSHSVGDQVLCDVARRLESGVRGADRIGRIGGDEFVCVLRNVGSVANLEKVVARVMAQLDGLSVEDGTLVTLSIGGAIAGEQDTAESLLHSADRAMYRAKKTGPGSWKFESPDSTVR